MLHHVSLLSNEFFCPHNERSIGSADVYDEPHHSKPGYAFTLLVEGNTGYVKLHSWWKEIRDT